MFQHVHYKNHKADGNTSNLFGKNTNHIKLKFQYLVMYIFEQWCTCFQKYYFWSKKDQAGSAQSIVKWTYFFRVSPVSFSFVQTLFTVVHFGPLVVHVLVIAHFLHYRRFTFDLTQKLHFVQNQFRESLVYDSPIHLFELEYWYNSQWTNNPAIKNVISIALNINVIITIRILSDVKEAT